MRQPTNGDTLVIAEEVSSEIIGDFDGYTLDATWTVVGGGGRFAGATGSGTLGAWDIPRRRAAVRPARRGESGSASRTGSPTTRELAPGDRCTAFGRDGPCPRADEPVVRLVDQRDGERRLVRSARSGRTGSSSTP
jgi:hypothetical protein